MTAAPHWLASMVRLGMRLGLSMREVLWETPQAVMLQLSHAEAAANGADLEWASSEPGSDTRAMIEALRAREFNIEI